MHRPSDDDDNPIDFLQQYRPTPPPAAPDLERRLMDSIVACQQPKRKKFSSIWFIPCTIAATIAIAWVGVDRNYQTARKIDDAEIEKVFLSDWQEVEASLSLPQEGDISEANWLLVTEENNSSLTTNDSLK
jgi:hypothetical protein